MRSGAVNKGKSILFAGACADNKGKCILFVSAGADNKGKSILFAGACANNKGKSILFVRPGAKGSVRRDPLLTAALRWRKGKGLSERIPF